MAPSLHAQRGSHGHGVIGGRRAGGSVQDGNKKTSLAHEERARRRVERRSSSWDRRYFPAVETGPVSPLSLLSPSIRSTPTSM